MHYFWLTDLEPYTEYTFRVRAVNIIGPSDWVESAWERTGIVTHRELSQRDPVNNTDQTLLQTATNRFAAKSNDVAYINGVGNGGSYTQAGQV